MLLQTAARAGVSPSDFWGLTLWEITQCAKAKSDEAHDQLRYLAWHAANVMNCWIDAADRVTPAQLLGESTKTSIEPLEGETADQFRARLASIRKAKGR